MSRIVLVVDVGQGQEAVIFADQRDAEAFLERHPAVDDCAQGMVPVATRGEVIRAANQQSESDR